MRNKNIEILKKVYFTMIVLDVSSEKGYTGDANNGHKMINDDILDMHLMANL